MSIPLIKRMRLVAQITRGLFLTDAKHSLFGRLWQLFLRFTWELPQTLIGWIYSVMRALAGGVDRVDVFGGITFVTKKAAPWMLGEGSRYVLGNQICMHEFGHTIDSQRFGWTYLFIIGLPSLMSAHKGDHNVFWTEIRANRHAKRYFSKYYSIAWNESGYPTENCA